MYGVSDDEKCLRRKLEQRRSRRVRWYCELNVCAPPLNTHVETLTPSVMVLRGD